MNKVERDEYIIEELKKLGDEDRNELAQWLKKRGGDTQDFAGILCLMFKEGTGSVVYETMDEDEKAILVFDPKDPKGFRIEVGELNINNMRGLWWYCPF